MIASSAFVKAKLGQQFAGSEPRHELMPALARVMGVAFGPQQKHWLQGSVKP
jgi:hypothetical protein